MGIYVKTRTLSSTSLVGAILGIVLCAGTAQSGTTPWGDPDLQGTFSTATRTTFERPDGVSELVITADQARRLKLGIDEFLEGDDAPTDPNEGAPEAGDDVGGYNAFWIDVGDEYMQVDGEYRSSIITYPTNGKMPYKLAARRKVLQHFVTLGTNMNGPEPRPLGERCIVGFGSTGGPPMLPVLYNNHYQFVQTPEHVMILVEMNHDARIIPIRRDDNDVTHGPSHVRPWMGDSIGYFEGDTLVVETKHFHPGQSLRAAIKHVLYMSTNATVIERFTRISESELRYEFEIVDPDALTDAVRGEMPMLATENLIYEYACHEGNYALPGILAGARREEQIAAGSGGEE